MDKKPDQKDAQAHKHIDEMSLTDLDGKPVSLKKLAGDAGVAIGFLHGTYCPACMQQLTRANRYADELAERRVKLVWLLQDKPASISAYQLVARPSPRYELLPDTEPSVATQFREASKASPDAPEPALVYLDPEGNLRYVEAPENPHAPLHIDELLKKVEKPQPSGKDKA